MIYESMNIRTLNEGDLQAILDLQESTIRGLKDDSILRRNSPEMLSQSLSSRNIALVVFVGDELIAIGIAVDPIPPETDLRSNLQNHSVDKAMDLKLSIVKEEYRGNGLQRALIWLLEKLACQRGFTHYCTSVSPNNPYSYNNVLAMGYEYDHQEELYGGLLRNVYVKELKVDEYNEQVILAAQKLVGTSFSSFSFDPADYIQGECSLCSTGDIAEYICEKTGTMLHGLIVKNGTVKVLLPNPDGAWEMMNLEPKDYGYKLQRVLLNVRQGMPSIS